MKPTAYLPAERLLAKYPGRLAAINAALAHCYIQMGLPVPANLLPSLNGERERVILGHTKGDK